LQSDVKTKEIANPEINPEVPQQSKKAYLKVVIDGPGIANNIQLNISFLGFTRIIQTFSAQIPTLGPSRGDDVPLVLLTQADLDNLTGTEQVTVAYTYLNASDEQMVNRHLS
jgi:hypothetical protein